MLVRHYLAARGRALSSITLAGVLIVGGAAACDDASAPNAPTATRTASTSVASAANADVRSDAAVSPSVGPFATPVSIEVFAPENQHKVGKGGIGWLVDLELEFPGGPLAKTGFNGFQLSGPGGHANIAPFPKPSTLGKDESLPSLVVMCSTSPLGAGAGQNLAGLFNITGITNLTPSENELWATWIVAGPACGVNTNTTMTIGVVADLNHDGIFNDAPNVVVDANGDGKVNAADLTALGVASNIVTRTFKVNP